MLEWVFRRCDGDSETVDSPIGLLPAEGELNTDGLEISSDAVRALLDVDKEALRAQMPQVEEHLARFGDDLPEGVRAQLEELKKRLG